MEQNYICVKEFADLHQVRVTTVYHWIHKGLIPCRTHYMGKSPYYLIPRDAPRPAKRSAGKGRQFIANHRDCLRQVPIIELPWHKDQLSMDQIIDSVADP